MDLNDINESSNDLQIGDDFIEDNEEIPDSDVSDIATDIASDDLLSDESSIVDGNMNELKTDIDNQNEIEKDDINENKDYDFRKVNWEDESLDFLKKEIYTGEDDKEKIKDIEDTINGIRDLTKENIKDATDIALKSQYGEFYTDHNEGHIEQVTYKSIEAGKAFADMAADGGFEYDNVVDNKNIIKLGSDIDYKVLAGAAMSHDTGMSDHGYNVNMNGGVPERDENGNIKIEEQTPEDRKKFDDVRSSHTLNSALNILKRRDKYKELGYNDEQIDNMAVLAFAHSKSNSGVKNLTNKEDWNTCFDVLDAAVSQYNTDKRDNIIKFDRTKTSSDDNLSRLALSTLALRVGDVSRDSGDGALAQSGEQILVEKKYINNDAEEFGKEVENDSCVMVKTADGDIKNMKNDNEESYIKSRQCHVGEQNIIHNKTYYDKKIHQIVHEVLINDGEYAQCSTAEAIKDHIGEFASSGVRNNFMFKFKTNTKWSENKRFDTKINKIVTKINDEKNVNIGYVCE